MNYYNGKQEPLANSHYIDPHNTTGSKRLTLVIVALSSVCGATQPELLVQDRPGIWALDQGGI